MKRHISQRFDGIFFNHEESSEDVADLQISQFLHVDTSGLKLNRHILSFRISKFILFAKGNRYLISNVQTQSI